MCFFLFAMQLEGLILDDIDQVYFVIYIVRRTISFLK